MCISVGEPYMFYTGPQNVIYIFFLENCKLLPFLCWVFQRLHLKLVACSRCGCQIVIVVFVAVAVTATQLFSFATLWQLVHATHIQ